MKKIIIFGATGNIGAYLTDYCIKRIDRNEYEIIACGRKNTNYFKENGITYIQVDIKNDEDFKKLPTENVYSIINLAGVLPAYLKDFSPFKYIDTNITGALNILEYARRTHTDRIIYTQTWAEQGGYWGSKTTLSPNLPRNLVYKGDHAFYAITKSMISDTLEYYYQEFGLKYFMFRLPNVYLYHPNMYYFVDGVEKPVGYRYMIEQAILGNSLQIWGNPDAFKDILYIKDLCQMMYKALFSDCNKGIYNAGTGIKTTLRDQIQGIIDVFSPHPEAVELTVLPDKPSFTSFVMDIDNAVNDLDYHPEYTYIKYLKDYKEERQKKRFNELWK